MSGYTQIYINKKINEGKKSKNQTYNFINNDFSNELNSSNQNNENKLLSLSVKLNERNPSVLTFSNLNPINNQGNIVKNVEKNNLNDENNKNNSFLNGMIINKDPNFIIEENRNRIKYRKKLTNKKNYFSSNQDKITINNKESDENKINLNQNPQKKDIIEKINEKKINGVDNNNISMKEKLKNQRKKNKEKNEGTIKSIKSIESEGNNNFTYEIKDIKYFIQSKKENKNENEKIVKKEKNEKSNQSSNLNEISIKTESSNNFINENNLTNNNNYKLSTIPRIEETFESLNLTKEQNNNNLLTKDQILYFTHIIFLNNASFVKNKECYMMSKSNFLNIMKSINMIKSQLILVEIDLIYDSISLKSLMINYSQFNQILMKIIKKFYQEQYLASPQLTINYFINKLIKQYNLFFENKIPKDYLYKYQYNSIVKIIQIFPNENQIVIIKHIILTINEIYEKYFTYELDYNKEYLYKSSENLVSFCRDFEISPQIINSTQAVTYYNLIIHIEQTYNTLKEILEKEKICKNKGKIFSLYHFILFIIHMSLYSYTKIFGSKSWNSENNTISKEEKLLLFLEKLDHSKGMTNFLSRLYTPRTKSLSLIPPREVCIALGILKIDKKKQKVIESLDDVFYKEKVNESIKIKEYKEKEKELLEA